MRSKTAKKETAEILRKLLDRSRRVDPKTGLRTLRPAREPPCRSWTGTRQRKNCWPVTFEGLRLIFHDLQVVRDGENSRHAVRLNICNALVRLAVNHPFQGYFSALRDNADRLLHSQSIFLECRVAIDGPVELPTKTFVYGRRRQHFNLIVNMLDAFNSLNYVFGVRRCCRPLYMPGYRTRPDKEASATHV